jgi:hypothetical protein
MPGGYFVQVKYPSDMGWVTVGEYETRAAARADAGRYRGMRDARDIRPKQVRLVSAARVAPHGGGGVVRRRWARVAFQEGVSISEIADDLNVSWRTAHDWAHARG